MEGVSSGVVVETRLDVVVLLGQCWGAWLHYNFICSKKGRERVIRDEVMLQFLNCIGTNINAQRLD